MNMLHNLFQPRTLVAFALQILFFGTFFFVDAKMTVAETWKSVLHFGLNPVVVLFFGLSPLVLWWSYREIMAAAESFWLAAMIQGLILRIVYVVCSYTGSRIRPSVGEVVGLILASAAVVVSSILNELL